MRINSVLRTTQSSVAAFYQKRPFTVGVLGTLALAGAATLTMTSALALYDYATDSEVVTSLVAPRLVKLEIDYIPEELQPNYHFGMSTAGKEQEQLCLLDRVKGVIKCAPKKTFAVDDMLDDIRDKRIEDLVLAREELRTIMSPSSAGLSIGEQERAERVIVNTYAVDHEGGMWLLSGAFPRKSDTETFEEKVAWQKKCIIDSGRRKGQVKRSRACR